MAFEEFRADDKTIDAVVRNFGIIGEAARHVPTHLQERYSLIPWSQMRGMRNVIIHEYSSVSTRIIWQTVTENLPPLVPMLQDLLDKES